VIIMRLSILSLVTTACLAVGASASAQAPATICKDGSTSAARGRGACADHGGVDKSATKQAKKAVKAEQKAEVQSAKTAGTVVSCADGSTSNPGRGACSHHGGVRVAGSAGAMTPAPSTPAARAPIAPAPAASAPAASAPMGSAPRGSAPAAGATHAPMAAAAASHRGEDNDPAGAIAQCKDGMYSHAANHRGACARHKGVAKWMQ
jgi:hypothetical protein